ncbi:TetR/AcrR family transcriptional regulator [Cyclobacterium sediminis]
MNVRSKVMKDIKEFPEKEIAIYEGALELVAKFGFHGTSMSLLTKEANVSTGTVYHYFSSKDDLMKKMYCYYRSKVEAHVSGQLEGKKEYKQRFYSRWKALYLYYTRNPKVLQFFEQFINSPYNQERSPHHFTGAYFTFLKEGIDNKYLKPTKPEIYVAMYMGSVVMASKINVFGSILLDEKDRELLINKLWYGMAEV